MKMIVSILLAAVVNMIPAPQKCDVRDGFLETPQCWTMSFVTDSRTDGPATLQLKEYIKECPEFPRVSILEKGRKNAILSCYVGSRYFKAASSLAAEEGYCLEVGPKGIAIKSATLKGTFHAFQTLRQMLLTDSSKLPFCSIQDAPAYGHRGLLFDVSRHFRSVDFICRQLDVMALLKMNVLHFHMEDTIGWRLYLDSHPELTRYAAFRKEKNYVNPSTLVEEPEGYVPGTVWDEPDCYGGYYSKENIREILEYAARLNITVIPEVELPGHSSELRGFHPNLFCRVSKPLSFHSVCPGRAETYEFFESILKEVAGMFPSEYIHIGGDETNKESWKICPDCTALMKKEGLADVEQLQSYMMDHMNKYVNSLGKKAIGWDEIMQGGLAEGATVMSWRGTEDGMKAMEMGHDVIMSPVTYCYLDYYQNAPHLEPNALGNTYLPLEKTYSFTMPKGEHMLGIQGNLWSEYINEDSHYEYMLYPRAFAIAEIGWTENESKTSYEDFKERSAHFCKVLQSKGYTTFDLAREQLPDQAYITAEKIEHKGRGARYTHSATASWQNVRTAGTRLTDGACKSEVVFSGPVCIVLDLGEKQDIGCVCAIVLSHDWHRRYAFPREMRCSVSEDGLTFREAGINRTMVNDGNLVWSRMDMPVFCDEKDVRYVKLEFVESSFCNQTAISEIIVK